MKRNYLSVNVPVVVVGSLNFVFEVQVAVPWVGEVNFNLNS